MVTPSLPPTHLALFAFDQLTGKPRAGLPLYAEVAVPRPLPPPEKAFMDWYSPAFEQLDTHCPQAVRDRVTDLFEQEVALCLTPASVASLMTTYNSVFDFVYGVFKEVLVITGKSEFADIPMNELKPAMHEAVWRVAERQSLETQPKEQAGGAMFAEPLGVLTTDHVGYASFDLRRLQPTTQSALAVQIALRKNDPNVKLLVDIWVYPYGQNEKVQALSQARFTYDAIVARIEVSGDEAPIAAQKIGPRSLQNPSLTDWRLSPASFAASPSRLLGEDGCEDLLPSNVALQEFVMRQVVRVVDADDGIVPGPYKFAYVDDYKVTWSALGHSLGEILYSLPLAPGESVRLAVIDWSWDSLTKRDEDTKLTEEVLHQTHRDRTITETVKAGLKELQHGSSFMGGMANSLGASAGANLGVVGLGGAAGNAWSFGGSTATSDGSRDLAAENVQRLSDSFAQASSSQREINSTVVIQARQEEKETIQTRTFTNYNHSHTLTVLYYEVLRHFKVTTEWVRRRRAALVKIPAALNFDANTAIRHRWQLERNLLDVNLKPAFDVLQKREAIRARLAQDSIPNGRPAIPGFWQGDFQFEYFEVGMFSKEGEGTKEVVVMYVVTKDTAIGEKKFELHYDYKGSGGINDRYNVNSGGKRLASNFGTWTFMKAWNPKELRYEKVRWADIIGFQIEKWGDAGDWRLDRLTINGLGADGLFVDLTEGGRDVDYWFEAEEPGSHSFTWFRKPPPRDAEIAAILDADRTLSLEDNALINRLLDHLGANTDYYNRVVRLTSDTNSIAVQFEGMPWGPGGKTLDDALQPTPLEVFGSYVAYPLADQGDDLDALAVDIAAAMNSNDPARRSWAQGKLASLSTADQREIAKRMALATARSERLISMSTRGVFAEGKLGHCNISEEIDNTRFWKWDEHPLPIEAPEIAPTSPITPTPTPANPTPTAFPAALVSIVSPTAAPDPTGLSAALTLLGTPNIFRDMSGRQEAADLLKKLSDNTISIAEAANKARDIQAKYGVDLAKNDKELQLGNTQASADVIKEIIKARREEAQQVKPNEAQDAIKLSESEVRKGNKTPEEHKTYSKQVQANVKGAEKKKPPKTNITLQINLLGYGPKRLIGRFGCSIKQKGTEAGFLIGTDYDESGFLKVGVTNDHDDNRYDVSVYGEVLAGLGVNALLKGGSTVVIPRADFDMYDYFYLVAEAKTDTFEFETTSSKEVTKEVATKLGLALELAYKSIITMTAEGGIEWKDGTTHTSSTAVKVKVTYYTGGFAISYDKGQ